MSFTLRWRILGIQFQISPWFWVTSAFVGWLMVNAIEAARDQIPGAKRAPLSEWIGLVLLWVLCTLVSVMVHELGHVIMGRFFGQPGDITIGGLGGQAAGKYEYLRPWERILVVMAGPGAGFLFLALQIAVDSHYWNMVMEWLGWDALKLKWFLVDLVDPLLRMGSNVFYTRVMSFLLLINLFVNLLNLLPIYPMDGGLIFREICMLISPVNGLKFTYVFSFFLAGVVVLYTVVKLATYGGSIGILDIVFVLSFGMLAYKNLIELRNVNQAQRAAHYREQFSD